MSSALAITRITHSCQLIEIGGLTLVTDPWFSEKAAYHPGEPIALDVGQLPRLDAVLISQGQARPGDGYRRAGQACGGRDHLCHAKRRAHGLVARRHHVHSRTRRIAQPVASHRCGTRSPPNGLRIRPLFNRKIVMDAHDAARLVAKQLAPGVPVTVNSPGQRLVPAAS